jgi:hypothetical protein
MFNQLEPDPNFYDRHALVFLFECPMCKLESEHVAEVLALANRIADLEAQLAAARDEAILKTVPHGCLQL